MSTETHTEAAGLAAALYDAEGFHAADSWATETAITRGRYEAQAAAALSWLTARLTDDDVVEAAARAIAAREGSRCFEQELTWSADRRAGFRDGARAALRAAAAVIGGEAS